MRIEEEGVNGISDYEYNGKNTPDLACSYTVKAILTNVDNEEMKKGSIRMKMEVMKTFWTKCV